MLKLRKLTYKTFSKSPSDSEVRIRIACPICGKKVVRSFWDCGNFLFSRCLVCGHIYQNPQPDAQDLLDRYDEEYKNYEVENSENFFNLMRFGLRDAKFFTLEDKLFASSLLANEAPRSIDIGCATGRLVRYLQDRGWNSEGMEVCRPAAEFGIRIRSVRIHIGSIDSCQLPEKYYDIVHFSHVIEHIPDINHFLAEVARITKIGGHVIITTPNRRSLQSAILGRKWRSVIADHTHLFNLPELKQLLRRHGFVSIRSKTWGGIPIGMSAEWLKKKVDRLVRLIGLGDVVMVIARRIDN